MQDQQRCQAAIQCLHIYGYDVIPDPPGYIIRHRSDQDDVSRARHCADLVELAELFEWAARRAKASDTGMLCCAK